jgi:hypothetical protein
MCKAHDDLQYATLFHHYSGASIFDFASGAASAGSRFIDAYAAVAEHPRLRLDKAALETYVDVGERVRALLQTEFEAPDGLFLTAPSFISRIDATEAVTPHDEYWHAHVDTLQYGSFAYTALIYLSTHGDDFRGGEFYFLDADADGDGDKDKEGERGQARTAVLPAAGRLLVFSSGAENTHHVAPVTAGVRYALTIGECAATAFTFRLLVYICSAGSFSRALKSLISQRITNTSSIDALSSLLFPSQRSRVTNSERLICMRSRRASTT